MKEKYLSENPAADLAEDVYRSTGAKKTAARDQREPFTPEELERVFSAAWFSTGTGERTRDGSFFTIGHIIFWLPLLGLFTLGSTSYRSSIWLTFPRRLRVLCI